MTLTAADIANNCKAKCLGDRSVSIAGLAQADKVKAVDLTFAEKEAYLTKAEESAASAVLVSRDIQSSSKTLIRVVNVRVAFAQVMPLLFRTVKSGSAHRGNQTDRRSA
jgi:UDP-3-O-[3-hydroxymyristoyl] glucosamine N-acyltransferase